MTITITNAKPEDTKGLIQVFHRTWLSTYPNKELGITVDDIEDKFKDAYSAENIQKRADHIAKLPDNERYVVAKDGESVVGLARFFRREEVNQMQAIYVLPEYQGQGIGRKLWDEGARFFDLSRKTIVEVATYNKKAIEFYRKLGFAESGRRFTDERHRMKSGALIPELEMVYQARK